MKIKNFFNYIGLKSKPKKFLYTLKTFKLDDDIEIKYAHWLHPSDKEKFITTTHIQAYKEFIARGDFCIDIGAHTGDSTIPIGLAAGKEGLVLALEPNPYVYHVLEKNARANTHVTNIETIMAAATTSFGLIEFEYSDESFCNGGRHEGISLFKHGHVFKQEVFGIDLVSELKEHYSDRLAKLKFIKIDAEGYDLYILKSIISLIETYKPYLKIEVFKKTSDQYRQELFNMLYENGYTIFIIDSEPVIKGKKLTIEDIRIKDHFDILAVPTKQYQSAPNHRN